MSGTKIDLDALERKARAEMEARAGAPKSLEGVPLITDEVANAAWDHAFANNPPVTLALVSRIRELESSLSSLTEVYRPIDAEPQWQREDTARALLAKGCVLP